MFGVFKGNQNGENNVLGVDLFLDSGPHSASEGRQSGSAFGLSCCW